MVLSLQPKLKKERMSRSTFNILFYANKGKEKNGIVPIIKKLTKKYTDMKFYLYLCIWNQI